MLNLRNKTARQRANLKGQEIARLAQKKAHDRQGGIRIEIVDTNAIQGGVEVFARAYKNGKQIGFGKDGTVDIERFRIINPPILVPDPQGDIVRVTEADPKLGTERQEFHFREDPQEALIQSLEHTIKVKQHKFGSENIVEGKVGNTTTTVYPDADPESTSVDGYVFKNDSTSWSITRNAGNGSFAKPTETSFQASATRNGSGVYTIARVFTLFDTSSIPDTDTIDSATYSTYITQVNNTDNDGDDFIAVVTVTPASNTNLVVGDYNQIGTTEQHDTGQRKDLSSVSISAYLDWTLNSTGLGNISKTGITKLGQIEGHDLLDNPVVDSDNTGNRLFSSSADTTGTTQDPKLVVEHSAAVIEKNLTETITLAETQTRSTSKAFTDAITLTASKALDAGRAFIDSITLQDSASTVFVQFVELLESITAGDTIKRTTTKAVNETVTLVENVAKQLGRAFTETVTLVENTTKQLGKSITEGITLVASIAKAQERAFTETVTLVASASKHQARAFTDSVTVSASIVRDTSKSIIESINLTARMQVLINGVSVLWRNKYTDKAGTWINKYTDKAGTWINKYLNIK